MATPTPPQMITIDDSGDEEMSEEMSKSNPVKEQFPGEAFLQNIVYEDDTRPQRIKAESVAQAPTFNPMVIDNQEEIRAMAEMQLPTSFQQQGPEYRGLDRAFFCQTCHVQMTTAQAFAAHENGAQHLKTQLNKELLEKGKVQRGQPGDYLKFEDHERKFSQKRRLKRLREKLLEVNQPYAGLKHVKEILSVTKADKEPHYCCQLCNFDGDAESMLNHLLGTDHQEKFLKELASVDVDLINLQEEIEKV